MTISKAAEKDQLATVVLMERWNELFREGFVEPVKFHCGFDTLPNELLLKILQLCPPLEQPRFALLNSRFRDLVYSSPPLWTYISTHSMSAAQIKRHVSMSQPLGLHFEALSKHKDGFCNEKDFQDRARICFLSDVRWHRISFDKDATYFLDDDRPNTDSVRVVDIPGFEFNTKTLSFYERCPDSFYEKWKFACATTLNMREYCPWPGSFTSIDTLNIEMDYPDLFYQDSAQPFLEALPRLRHLIIHMDFTRGYIGPQDGFFWERKSIKLDHVQSFSYSARVKAFEIFDGNEHLSSILRSSDDYVFACVASFSLPIVEKFSLGFSVVGPGANNNCHFCDLRVDSLFLDHHAMPKLDDFHLKLDPVSPWDECTQGVLEDFISCMYRRFPSIGTFTVHVPTKSYEYAAFADSPTQSKPPSEDLFNVQLALKEYSRNNWHEDSVLRGNLASIDAHRGQPLRKDGKPCLSLNSLRRKSVHAVVNLCTL